MKKGQIYEGVVEEVLFPNKGQVRGLNCVSEARTQVREQVLNCVSEARTQVREQVLNCVSEARTQVRERVLNCRRYKRTTRGKQNWKNKGF